VSEENKFDLKAFAESGLIFKASVQSEIAANGLRAFNRQRALVKINERVKIHRTCSPKLEQRHLQAP
jgi:hypothetical protein